jgi:hypothetical protein
MLEDVEATAFGAPYKQKNQRKKKRGRLLYSTPKELARSRMRRCNVLPQYSANHSTTSRTLDFEDTDIEVTACNITCIQPIFEEEAEAMTRSDEADDMDSFEQVSSKFNLTFLVL